MCTIRKASLDDAEAACLALRRSIVECCQEDHGGVQDAIDAWLANKTPETVRAWIRSPGHVVVAESDGAVAGVGMLGVDGRIALCYLVPEARYLGAGKAMLQALEDEARRRGQKYIELGSTRTAQGFYQRNGYVDTGTVECAFGLSCVMMRKEMDPKPRSR